MATEKSNGDVTFLEGFVKEHPDSILFARLAEAYLAGNRVDEAISLCEDGLKKHPYYATGHFVLGKGYMAKQLYEQAEKEFKRVLLFDPKFLAAHKMYGDLMKEIGWENTCEMSYKKILEIDPLDEFARKMASEQILAGEQPDDEDAATLIQPPELPLESPAEMAPAPDLDVSPESSLDIDLGGAFDLEPEPELTHSPPAEPEPSADPLGNDNLDLDAVSPIAVTEEEEYLLFEEPEAKTEEVIKAAMPDDRGKSGAPSEVDEFSYILDDIFKDEVDEAGPEKAAGSPHVVDSELEVPASEPQVDDLLAEFQAPNDAAFGLDPEPDTQESDPPLQREDVADEPPPFASQAEQPTPDFEPEPAQPAKPVKSEAEPEMPQLVPPEPELPRATTSARKRQKQDKIVTPTLGEIYAAQGQYSKAIDVFETLIKKHPDNEFYIQKIATLKQKLTESQDES